ncbi:YhaN family protein [Synechococcus sp. CS-1328]|uniref:ATP-binding protein n=1 Tax=Synechococcus sp. CS-1328 TaxID=2847976 RepID=UPI00223A7020|nr:YhaN family protein [Synechococcus sp. CS-1328]MCT0225602.1 AAA family ATPase [Synechococcus sp. CS-1328]
MRIKRLDLLAFGPFTNKSLDLSNGNPGLHVIHGPNEAGKSSTLRALKAWLFGIEARSTDNFVHDNRQLRVGGVLETPGGTEIACVRRKGNKDTLLDASTEEPIGEDTISNVLRGLDEKLFSQLHGIDHTGLIQGGQAILEQSGDLGKSLFGAALGTQGKADLLSDLASEADKLFKSRGQTQTINTAVARLKDARREEKISMVSVGTWKELRQALRAAEETVVEIDEKIAEARRRKSKLERFRRIAVPLAERRSLLEREASLGDVLLLPEDFDLHRREATQKQFQAREQLQKANAKLERVKQEADELDVPKGLIENQDSIEELQLHLGAFQQSLKDKPAQDAKRRTHRNAAVDLLKCIRPDLDLESVETLKPLLNRERLIANLAEKSNLLKQKSGQIDACYRKLSVEKEGVEQQLEAMPTPSKGVFSLQAAIKAARKQGDLAERLRNARNVKKKQEEGCSRDLSRLGRFEGSLEELASLAMPEKAVLDNFEKKFEELNEHDRDTVRRQAETRQELDQAKQALRSLLIAAAVPTLGDLQTARDHREQGWRLIRRKYLDGAELGAAATDYAGSQDLPGAYEQAVVGADNFADWLRLDAERVQARVLLETTIQTRYELLSTLEGELKEQAVYRTQLENDWQGVWRGNADKIGSPREMKEWLLRVDQLLEKAGQLDNIRAEVQKLEMTEALHLEALNAELDRLDGEFKSVELEALLSRCEQVASDQENTARRHIELKDSLQNLEMQLKAAAIDHHQASEEMRDWEVSWAKAVDGLGLGVNPLPDLVVATMEKLEEMFEELKEADNAFKRIYGMEKFEERFSDAVTQLSRRITFNIQDQTPAETAQSMVRQLSKAQGDDASLKKLQGRIRELEEEIAESRQDIQLAEKSLDSLRAQAGVSSDEELIPVFERSDQKRQINSCLETLLHQLNQYGEGLSIDELEKEVQEQDLDQVDNQLEQLESKLAELSKERDAGRDQRQKLIVEIQALDGSSKAADAAERAEQLLATIVPDAEQYLRLTISRLILEEQIENYRQANQTPVLKRAGELFAKLTLGSFSGLHDEIDDKGKPVLLGVRSDKSEVSVSGMSEGTRDQLFLALRLATIELQKDQQDPLPFVVDDILVGFDDRRSKACLDVLSEFARKTQVLVFTHHSMVAQAANELGEEKGVFVHELNGSPSPQ